MRNDYQMKRGTFTFNGRRYETYARTDKELKQKIAEKKLALKRGEVVIESTMSVRAWAEQCTKAYRKGAKETTNKNFEYSLNHYILSNIGDMRLKDVKPLTCQLCINELEGKSQYLINYVSQIMNFIFQKAVDNDLINKNPAKNITKPQGTKEYRRALTTREEEVFKKCAKEYKHGLYFMLMYGCGCRPSEAQNVMGKDIIITDDKALLHIRGTKTKSADRYVPIPPDVMELLPARIEPFQLLCQTSQGNSLKRQHKRAWDMMKRLMNIEMGCRVYRNELIPPYPLSDDLCPYCLRHTYCTNLQKRGVDIRTAQTLMGHTDITLTANIYTHVSQEQILNEYDVIVGEKEGSKLVNFR